MGNIIPGRGNSPIHTHNIEYHDYKIKIGHSKGGRPTNEDDILITEIEIGKDKGLLLVVFDGHGGRKTSTQSASLFKDILESNLIKDQDIPKSLKKTITDIDTKLREERVTCGSTCTCAVIHDGNVHIGNLGDSRTVLYSNELVKFASEDHKPFSEDEMTRIKDAGGFVVNNRVVGDLAVSRALGDFYLKIEPDTDHPKWTASLVSSDMDVTTHEFVDNDYLVLACDGIWDVYSNESLMEDIKKHRSSPDMTEEIMEKAFSMWKERRSSDNISMIIISKCSHFQKHHAVSESLPFILSLDIEEEKTLEDVVNEDRPLTPDSMDSNNSDSEDSDVDKANMKKLGIVFKKSESDDEGFVITDTDSDSDSERMTLSDSE